MVGMLQIMTYLLCVYLVYKGFEILQIALVSGKSISRGIGIAIGGIAVLVSFYCASVFVKMIDAQAQSVANH
jgi:hypothetical protein